MTMRGDKSAFVHHFSSRRRDNAWLLITRQAASSLAVVYHVIFKISLFPRNCGVEILSNNYFLIVSNLWLACVLSSKEVVRFWRVSSYYNPHSGTSLDTAAAGGGVPLPHVQAHALSTKADLKGNFIERRLVALTDLGNQVRYAVKQNTF